MPRAGVHPDDRDARDTRRAALSIGWQIMLASAFLVLGIVVIAIVFVLHQALPREQLEATGADSSHIYVDSNDILQALILLGLGAVVFAGVVSWIIARRAVRPLGDALRLQRQFVADASHELRTPLAVLDARLQVVQRRQQNGAEVTPEALSELRADTRALVEIVGDLLLAAGGDGGGAEVVDAGPIVAAAASSLAVLAQDRGVTITTAADGRFPVAIPATSLRRSVVALVDNAIAHSPAGGHVTVALRLEGGRVALTVADEGPGITGIEPDRVFDRFAHTEPAAGDSRRPGFGIGLALVRELAGRQGGSVRVASTSDHGTTFRLELPAAPST